MKQFTAFLGAAVAVAIGLSLAPARVSAQASITATAVVEPALTVNAGNDLEFGSVLPGFMKTIAVSDATAGTFDLAGAAGAEVNFTFSALPSDLTFGANNLPITYTGVHNTVNDPITGATSFTPSAGDTTPLHGTTGELYVFLGGTVDATGSPPAGTYTGTVTLTGAYTGN